MLDLTDYMNGTPFKTPTFRFMATDDKDAKRDYYYTPYEIVNWRYSANPGAIGSIENFVHDISHIIDLYERGETAKLLKVDFGWKLGGVLCKRSDAAIMTELRTISIQEILCRDVLGRPPVDAEDSHGFWRTRLRKVRLNPQFLRGRGAFQECVDGIVSKCEAKGTVGYLKTWKAACRFIENYRN